MNGSDAIKAERQRQISREDFDAEHDDAHTQGQLLAAAECYLQFAEGQMGGDVLVHSAAYIPDLWPWSDDWWKPKPFARRNFVVAGALALAESHRLQRQRAAGKVNDVGALDDCLRIISRAVGCINDIDKGA